MKTYMKKTKIEPWRKISSISEQKVWSLDEVRPKHASTKHVKSGIDTVQKTAKKTQAYMG